MSWLTRLDMDADSAGFHAHVDYDTFQADTSHLDDSNMVFGDPVDIPVERLVATQNGVETRRVNELIDHPEDRPVRVLDRNDTLYIWDGHHQAAAAIWQGATTVRCVIAHDPGPRLPTLADLLPAGPGRPHSCFACGKTFEFTIDSGGLCDMCNDPPDKAYADRYNIEWDEEFDG